MGYKLTPLFLSLAMAANLLLRKHGLADRVTAAKMGTLGETQVKADCFVLKIKPYF